MNGADRARLRAVEAEETLASAVPLSLYLAAVGSGFSYANLAVALPLYVLASGGSPDFAAQLLGLQTCSIALGSLAAGPLLARLSCWRALAGGLVLMSLGQAALFVVPAGVALAPGAAVHGIGLGVFWVSTQALLATRSGSRGSERAFVNQYALYVVGTTLGAAVTGLGVALLQLAGVGEAASTRATFALALGAAAVSAARCRRVRGGAGRRGTAASPRSGLAIQLPDLLLVAGMALVLSLAPIVLKSTFGLSPLEIGLVVGANSAAKIAGSYLAGWLTGSAGARRAIVWMLAAAAPLTAALAARPSIPLFVSLLLAAALLMSGVWPVLVDAAHARIAPEERQRLAVAWNVREYLVIAATTSIGGWLLSAFAGPAACLLLGAALLAASALASAAVLRRPVYAAPAPAAR